MFMSMAEPFVPRPAEDEPGQPDPALDRSAELPETSSEEEAHFDAVLRPERDNKPLLPTAHPAETRAVATDLPA